MIETRKNVPMPTEPRPVRKYPWRTMEVGDSFIFPADVKQTSVHTLARLASRDGKKFKARKQDDGSYACWRIE